MITAILLAAGESKRMGAENKLLLPFEGRPLVEHVARTLLQSDAGDVIVVVGHEAERVQALLAPLDVTLVHNPRYAEGMTTSIHAGVQASPPDAEGFMICLSDLPLIEAAEYDELIAAFAEVLQRDERRIVVPVHAGRRGNPVLFSAYYRAAILDHQGLMGCRGIVKQNADRVIEVEMATDHVLRDVDTREAYKQVIRSD